MPRPYTKYSQADRQHALEQVRIDASQGIPASVTARRIGINPNTIALWAKHDRTLYNVRLSAIYTRGIRFQRDMSENARLRRTQFALRRLSLYRAEHGITLRPTPWPADDPRRIENKRKAASDTTSGVDAKPARGKQARK
jgi:hypothetical protein